MNPPPIKKHLIKTPIDSSYLEDTYARQRHERAQQQRQYEMKQLESRIFKLELDRQMDESRRLDEQLEKEVGRQQEFYERMGRGF